MRYLPPPFPCLLEGNLVPSICSDWLLPNPSFPFPSASCSQTLPFFLTGIKHELQANCYEEVKDRCTLAEKLGGSAVISLEGKPL